MRRKTKGDVEFYVKVKKRPITYSTTATSDMLKVLSEEWKCNILEMRQKIEGLVGVEDEKRILDVFTKDGYGERFMRLH